MKKTVFCGILTAFAVWVPLVIADAIDEFCHNSIMLSGWVFLLMPFGMLALYIRHYLKEKPPVKRLIAWMLSYALPFLPLWAVFWDSEGDLIIHQSRSTNYIDLNGIEYMFYGFSVLCAFAVMVLLFHAVYQVIRHCKKTKKAG